MLPLQSMRAAALIWLVASGIGIVMLGASFPSRARAGSAIMQCGAAQLAIAFLFVLSHPSRTDTVLHAGVTYAASLGAAQIALGLSLRRAQLSRPAWRARLIEQQAAQLVDSAAE